MTHTNLLPSPGACKKQRRSNRRGLVSILASAATLPGCIFVSLDKPTPDEGVRPRVIASTAVDLGSNGDCDPCATAEAEGAQVAASSINAAATTVMSASSITPSTIGNADSGASSNVTQDAGSSGFDASLANASSTFDTPKSHAAPDASVADPQVSSPTMDARCAYSGELACDINNPTQKLVCSQSFWQSNGGCDEGQNCNPANGRCKAVVPECEGASSGERRCGPNDQLIVCGPNSVSIESTEACPGRCVSVNDVTECAEPFCGNGKTQGNEECDDGNDDNTDECTELCAPPFCGDGFINNAETCDDGNDDNTDECTELCARPFCGDGFINNDETCDDGNDDNTDECTELCAPPVCGDGFTNNDEDCDHTGNVGCTLACRWIVEMPPCFRHTCVRRGDGVVKCWGNNQYGQLGLGDTQNRGDQIDEMGDALPSINLGSGRTALAITGGNLHTCAILDDHSIKCWGNNQYGQLGLGDTSDRGDDVDEMGDALPTVDLGFGRSALAIAGSNYHTCAILDDKSVKCWGNNEEGRLGYGDVTHRGDNPNEMGDALPAVDFGSQYTARAIATRSDHTCVLLEDGAVKCWGRNTEGQLGLGDTFARGDDPNEMGGALAAVDLGSGRTAIAVAAGVVHTCVILDNHSVRCWGANNIGQLGLGDNFRRGDEGNEMGNSLPTVDLGPGRTASTITTGHYHSCVLLDDRTTKCWGYNDKGQLGIGSRSSLGDGSGEMGAALPIVDLGSGHTALAIAASLTSTCAILDDGSIKCWGNNDAGQLGLGHTLVLGDQGDEMGDFLTPVSIW